MNTAVNPRLSKTVIAKEETASLDADFGEGYHTTYRSVVGAWLWVAVLTRPDISFAVIQVAKHVCGPSSATFPATFCAHLRYLAGTRTFVLPS